MHSLYEILEVSPNASGDVIRAAYRCLAQKHHPDKLEQAAVRDRDKKMSDLNFAYSVLSDPAKRSKYDIQIGLNIGAHDRRRGEGSIRNNGISSRDNKPSVRPFGFRPFV
ncbi:J domain-containing protein [Curvibacter sp. AEP1-3]|uniref:J domain-containing protein n=1 Tax=Curvibacter sp. AEP1-3 TaxID=1844971 RepID=UPI000B3C702B